MFVVLLRHAEREPLGSDPDPSLSPAGRARAKLLAAMLADTGIDAVFTSELKRTKETAAPISEMLGLSPVELADVAAAKEQVRSAGRRVLVVGHSNTVPELIAALNGPLDVSIGETEFNRLFVLNVQKTASHLLSMKYGAM